MLKKSFFYFFAGLIMGVALSMAVLVIFKKPLPLSPVISKEEPVAVQEDVIPALAPQSATVTPTPAAVTPTPAAVTPSPEVKEQVLEEKPAVVPEATPTPESASVLAVKPEFQKGMTYVAWTESGYSNPESVKVMEQMASLGVEWAALVITQFQDRFDSPKIYPVRDKTPSDESLIFAIRKLHDLKFKLMLKPHLDLVESNGKWRGDIGFSDSNGWEEWFKNYTSFILHYATIAAEENVEQFCIGTELANATLTQPAFWKDLINKVRQVYKGKLTYGANWDEEFERIEFWNELDYAGVDSYFFLAVPSKPTVEDLKDAWKDWIRVIEAWQKNINKPVIFTEIGYKSATGSVDEPWQYASFGELDLSLQANSYKALLESFWDKPWFYGVYWWYWGVNPKMGGPSNRGFTPQNKPAQDVIKEWYKEKPVAQK